MLVTLAAVLAIGSGAVVTASSSREASVEVLGGNAPLNAGGTDPRDISSHNSPTLVANPRDARNLVVANRVDTPRFSCALHSSSDGGRTWAQTALAVPAGEEPRCHLPDAAFGADGTLYVSFVTYKGDGNLPNAVWVSSSRDGGRTLSAPARALGPLAFHARLAADPTTPGRLFLTWLQTDDVRPFAFPRPGYPLNVVRSDDGGQTWRAPVRVSDAGHQRAVAPELMVGHSGRLYVAYLDLGEDRLEYEGAHEAQGGEPYAGRWRLVVAQSSDEGATWSATVVDDIVPTERFLAFFPPLPSLAVGADHVHVAFTDGRLGDADVWVWTSDDGGRRFAPPRRVNDTRHTDATTQYRPKISVARNGRLDVVYYDRRGDRRDIANEVSFQSSFDDGGTFTPRTKVSERSFDSRVGFGTERNMADLGSRLALISSDDRAYMVWSDTRAGTEVSKKQDLARALVHIAPPRRAPAWAKPAIGGGVALICVLVLLTALSWLGRRRHSPSAGC